MDALPIALDLDRVGVVAICVLIALAYMRGWVVTPRELRQVEKAADEWHAAADRKDAQIAEKDIQLGHLKQVGLTVEQLARGLQQEIDR